MTYAIDKHYFRVCDECGATREIKYDTYLIASKKEYNFCLSCTQKGTRNHSYGKMPWNKGLTKETDDRVLLYSMQGSQAKKGSVPWNKGQTYDQLKGKEWAENFKHKISELHRGKALGPRDNVAYDKSFRYFRKLCKTMLYTSWVYPILERDQFTCQLCGSTKNLEVHHIKPFKEILKETASKTGMSLADYRTWSPEEFNDFRNEILKAHHLEDGITYCTSCHMLVDKNRRRFSKND